MSAPTTPKHGFSSLVIGFFAEVRQDPDQQRSELDNADRIEPPGTAATSH
ncbi:MAG TPA: hypothetical protein VJR89_32725 [Polyangiales bacterium]|nr:hypothetical protein [Polyangiales bacterium]